ncbi:TraG family conjugative transposon ATPase [Sphingobacterium sp.]|uniref:TraG family conjugative transposon ATPase n=1 Tax=Sphingobacterium sp. TaxID=341027 RepID=UPI0028AF8AD8|nr:TraG family conjugative transposon ATPase [Sphingobacterium sp.]
MDVEFQRVFPLMDVEHDCIISKRGDVTLVFRASLPEIFSLSDGDFETFHQSWISALKTLPQGSIVHKQDWFEGKYYQADISEADESFLDRASERYFNERPYLDHQCYIMLTKSPASRKGANSLFSSLIRGDLVPAETIQIDGYRDFFGACGQFKRILEDSGLVYLERMTGDELRSSRDRAGLIERYIGLGDSQGKPALRDIDFSDGIQVGDRHCQLFTLSDAHDLPQLCGSRIDYERYSTDSTRFSVGFASPLGQLLGCDHVYNQYIFVSDEQKVLKRLERKRLRLQSLSAYSRANRAARDAAEDFLNEAITHQRLPVRAHYNVLAWTNQPKDLPSIKNKVSSAMAKMDATCKEESVGAPQIFWAGIPGNSADLPMNDTFETFAEHASCFLNLESSSETSLSPTGIRLADRLTGRPVHVDISDEPILKGICTNRNKFILGPTGSGKSFFTNHMLRSYHQQGSHVVLVDVGHSYRGLCQMAGGRYFTYSEQEPIRFNPFFLGQGDSLDTEKKESIKTLLLALWKKDDESFRRSEYVALSNAISGYFGFLGSEPEVWPCFDSFYEYLRDLYAPSLQVDGVRPSDFDIANFLYVLRPFYKGGEFDYLLNSPEALNLLEERFIVFELDNIKDHPILFPVVTIIIMEVFIAKMRKVKGVRKIILIEEAWKALMKEGFAQYIKYLFKTVRKFFGEAVVVTQDIEDIISSPVVRQTIINNSDCKILMDQRKFLNRFEHIQKLLGLTEKEKAMVLSINRDTDPEQKYKEVFISLGGVHSRVYRNQVSLEEYLCYTTEEAERVKLMEYTVLNDGDLTRGIAEMARDIRNGTLKI